MAFNLNISKNSSPIRIKQVLIWMVYSAESWNFKVWKRGSVKAHQVPYEWSCFIKTQGFFCKVAWLNHTCTPPNTHTKNVLTSLFLKENNLKIFWSRAFWIKTYQNDLDNILKCTIDWNMFQINLVSSNYVLNRLEKCLNH